jgi:hypothetical protein
MPGPDPRKNRKEGKKMGPTTFFVGKDGKRKDIKLMTREERKEFNKKDQGDILGERFDKKFKKYAGSKESQLQADDFDAGVNRAEKRAAKEVMQEAGIPMAKGGRAGFKAGSKGCKLAKRGRGRAYGKNS